MTFDYLVVGAGASGCALASRLSEDPTVQVLLIESGPRHAPTSSAVPRALPFALRSRALTSYPTTTGDYWVRGQGLGGSTLVNGMLYQRGEPAAYDELADAGNDGWGWSTFAAAFDEIERRFLHPNTSSLNAIDRFVLEAAAGLGIPIVADLNAAAGPRAGATPSTVYRGLRRSSARAFLPTRDNVRVLPNADATALSWEGDRVVGVRARQGSAYGEIRAQRVVLCAGTIATPLLLERSGIGQGELLRDAGIPVRVERSNVGQRVREQRGVGLQVRLRDGLPDALEVASPVALLRQAVRYAMGRPSALSRPAYDVSILLAAGGTEVDTQVLVAPFALAPGPLLRPAPYPGLTLTGYSLRPSETGSVHLDPTSPYGTPIITPPAIERDASDRTLAAMRRLVDTSPLRDASAGEDGPPNASIYHAVGSAAMGPADDDVVDGRLQVRGAEGLYIADLSVLPFHPSGGTAAPAMALGWIAGGLLLAN